MLDLAIVGAGPAGLATAIAAREAGLRARVIEKGLLVNSIFHFPRNQVFFTTPELLEIGGLPFVTPFEKPTRVEALRYYRRVADHFGLDMALGRRVLSIERGDAGFELRLGAATPPSGFATAAGPDPHPGSESAVEALPARNVVIATGYYDTPNRLGVPGEDLPHVAHYYAEAHAYYQQRVVVVGGKNSAALAALDLHRHGAHVTLVHRGPRLSDSIKYWIKPDIENRIRQGAIAARFSSRVTAIHPDRVETETAAGVLGAEELRSRRSPHGTNAGFIPALEPDGVLGAEELRSRRSPHGTDAGFIPASEPDGGLGAEELRSRRSPHGTDAGFIPALEPDNPESLPADAVFLLTGYRPDQGLLRSAGVEVDAATARPHHDEATFETNVGGLFVAGSIVSGSQTNQTFIENGRFHGERIVATIVSRRA